MAIRNCDKIDGIRKIEHELFDKEAEFPENALRVNDYKAVETHLYEFVKHEDLIQLIKSYSLGSEYYISLWNESNYIYEIVIDETIEKDYMDFMYHPENIHSIRQPNLAFAFTYDSIYIFNKQKTFALIADSYYEITLIYTL